MKRPAKIVVATTLGATLLLGGTTYALWNSSTSSSTKAEILTGESSVTALDSGLWTDLASSRKAPEAPPVIISDINSFRAVPSDEIGYAQLFNVKYAGGATGKNLLQLKFNSDAGLNPAALNARGIVVQATVKDLDTGKTATSDLTTSTLTTGYTFDGSLPSAGARVQVSVNFKINSEVTAEDTKKLQSLVSSSVLSVTGISTPVITAVAPIEFATNSASSYQLKATGTPAPTWKIVSGTLPTGMTLDATTGLISGKPTVSARSQLVVSATNSAGTATTALDISVTEPVVFSTDSVLPEIVVGLPYSVQLVATGNPTFSIASNTEIPAGLTLSRTGLLSGTPIQNQKYQNYVMPIVATNAKGSVTKTFTTKLSPVAITTPNEIVWYEYATGSIPIKTSGLGPDSQVSVVHDTNSITSFPSGARMVGSAMTFDGTLREQNFNIVLKATNSVGASVTKGFTVKVLGQKFDNWVNGGTTVLTPINYYSYNTALGNRPTGALSIVSGAFPKGITLNTSNGRIFGTATTGQPATSVVIKAGTSTTTINFPKY